MVERGAWAGGDGTGREADGSSTPETLQQYESNTESQEKSGRNGGEERFLRPGEQEQEERRKPGSRGRP